MKKKQIVDSLLSMDKKNYHFFAIMIMIEIQELMDAKGIAG